MATFSFTGPDGQTYEVEGFDDEETARKVLEANIFQGVQDEYKAMPWYQKAGTAADDLIRIGANAFTLGGVEHLAGLMPGSEGYDAEKWATEKSRIRAGTAALPADIAGYLALGRFLPSGVDAAGNAVGGSRVLQALTKGTTAGIETAALGGAHSAIEGKPVDEGMLAGLLSGIGGQSLAGIVRKGAEYIPTIKGMLDKAGYYAGEAGPAVKEAMEMGREAGRRASYHAGEIAPAVTEAAKFGNRAARYWWAGKPPIKTKSVQEPPTPKPEPMAPKAEPPPKVAEPPPAPKPAAPVEGVLGKRQSDFEAAAKAFAALQKRAADLRVAADKAVASAEKGGRTSRAQAFAEAQANLAEKAAKKAEDDVATMGARLAEAQAVPRAAPKAAETPIKAKKAPPPRPTSILGEAGAAQSARSNVGGGKSSSRSGGAKKPPESPSDVLKHAVETAERQSGSATGTVAGYDAAIGDTLKELLANPAKKAMFNPETIAAMERVIRGDRGTKLARKVGRLGTFQSTISSGGLGWALGGGMAAPSGPGAVIGALTGVLTPPAVGALARREANKGSREAVEDMMRVFKGVEKTPPVMSDRAKRDVYEVLRRLGIENLTGN